MWWRSEKVSRPTSRRTRDTHPVHPGRFVGHDVRRERRPPDRRPGLLAAAPRRSLRDLLPRPSSPAARARRRRRRGALGDLRLGTVWPVVGALVVRAQPRNPVGWLMLVPALIGPTSCRDVRRAHRGPGRSAARGVGRDLGVRALLLHAAGAAARLPRRPPAVPALAAGSWSPASRRGRAHHRGPDVLDGARRHRPRGVQPAGGPGCRLAEVRHPGRRALALLRGHPARCALPRPPDASRPRRRAHPAPVALPGRHRPDRGGAAVRGHRRLVGPRDRARGLPDRDRRRDAAARSLRRRAHPQPHARLRPAHRLRGRVYVAVVYGARPFAPGSRWGVLLVGVGRAGRRGRPGPGAGARRPLAVRAPAQRVRRGGPGRPRRRRASQPVDALQRLVDGLREALRLPYAAFTGADISVASGDRSTAVGW